MAGQDRLVLASFRLPVGFRDLESHLNDTQVLEVAAAQLGEKKVLALTAAKIVAAAQAAAGATN